MESTTIAPDKKLWRDEKHDHFWIEDGVLFETYHTWRGPRFRYRKAVFGMPDSNKLSEADITFIENNYRL